MSYGQSLVLDKEDHPNQLHIRIAFGDPIFPGVELLHGYISYHLQRRQFGEGLGALRWVNLLSPTNMPLVNDGLSHTKGDGLNLPFQDDSPNHLQDTVHIVRHGHLDSSQLAYHFISANS